MNVVLLVRSRKDNQQNDHFFVDCVALKPEAREYEGLARHMALDIFKHIGE
jgi:hypothetical protein